MTKSIYLPMIFAAILCSFVYPFQPIKTASTQTIRNQSYDTIARLPEANATLTAIKKGHHYEDFVLHTKNGYQSFPDWKNVINHAYAPKMFFDDIDKDGKRELIIVLTTGYGTGVLLEQVHVLHEMYDQNKETSTTSIVYNEILVDHPIAVILRNVQTKLSIDHAEITIDGHKKLVDLSPLQIQPKNVFPDISLGNHVKFSIENHELLATIGAQVSPASYIGAFKITYTYKNKLFQSKEIRFETKLPPAHDHSKDATRYMYQ